MNNSVPLTQLLKDWVNTPMADLPVDIKALAEEACFPLPWDKLSAALRREYASMYDDEIRQRDAPNDPAGETEVDFWGDFFAKKAALEEAIEAWEIVATPTALDLDKKENRLNDLYNDLAKIRNEQVHTLALADFGLGNAAAPFSRSNTTCQAVSKDEIKRFFQVLPDPNKNGKWWDKKMRNAVDCHLDQCRVGKGKTGPGGSLWRPDLIAGWLVDRDEKNLQGLNSIRVRGMLKKFPECVELAERMFPNYDE